MIECFDFIFSVYICLNKMRCQFFIGGKKVGLFAMTEQQHLSLGNASLHSPFILFTISADVAEMVRQRW